MRSSIFFFIVTVAVLGLLAGAGSAGRHGRAYAAQADMFLKLTNIKGEAARTNRSIKNKAWPIKPVDMAPPVKPVDKASPLVDKASPLLNAGGGSTGKTTGGMIKQPTTTRVR